MSRPEEARDPAQNTTTDWYRSFAVELASHGLPASEVERTAASTRAEAEAAGVPPATCTDLQSSTPARSPQRCGTIRRQHPPQPHSARRSPPLPVSTPHLPGLRPQPPWSCA